MGGVAVAVESLYMEWQDANGAFYRTRNYMAAGSNPTAFLSALQGLCNAGLQQETHGGVTAFVSTAPISGTAYDSVFQIGQVSYTTATPAGIRVMLPALIKTNLLPDNIRINPSSLAAFDTAVLATLTDNLGNAATVRTTAIATDRRNDQQ